VKTRAKIEAALAGKLPEDLVTLEDIRGMVHCTRLIRRQAFDRRDGARGASDGMKYMTITDHSPRLFMPAA